MIDALLIYPRLGNMDSMMVDPPLSIIYAAAESVQRGYNIKCLDMRCTRDSYQEALRPFLEQGVRLAGISVMTGAPLRQGSDIARFIKANYPGVKVVWGGPHATVLPETVQEGFLDFLVRGYGSHCLAELIEQLRSDKPDFSNILGLSYKEDGQPRHNPRSTAHEMLHYRDLPYDLLDLTLPCYGRTYANEQVFPIFSAIGCPYQCSFCMHPTVYRKINGAKWRPYAPEDVVDHIQLVMDKFGVSAVAFIDDTSFPDLKRMRRIFQIILERGIKVELHFRGARVNEIDRMDDDFLDLMGRAGGRVLMVGVESASAEVLKRMQKGINKEQIMRVNRKLARFPRIKPHYNLVWGTPGETYENVVETKDTVLQMLKDNPNIYFGIGGDWKPIPGSKMMEMAEKEFNYQPPRTLEEWIKIDTTDAEEKIVHPWYSRRQNNMIKLMQLSSFVLGDKIVEESSGNNSGLFQTFRFLARLYKPVAMFRLRRNFPQLLVEYEIWRLVARRLSDLTA